MAHAESIRGFIQLEVAAGKVYASSLVTKMTFTKVLETARFMKRLESCMPMRCMSCLLYDETT